MKVYHTFTCHTCPETRKGSNGPDVLPFESPAKRDEFAQIHRHYYPHHKTEIGKESK